MWRPRALASVLDSRPSFWANLASARIFLCRLGLPSARGHLHPSPALGVLAAGLPQGFPADLALWTFDRVRSFRTLRLALENQAGGTGK